MSAPEWTFNPEHIPTASSAQEMVDAARRDSYYAEMYAMGRKTIQQMAEEIASLRASLGSARIEAVNADRRALSAEQDAERWMQIAVKFATITDTDWRHKDHTVRGQFWLAFDAVLQGGEDAIRYACLQVAQKLIADRSSRTGGQRT